MPDDPTALLLAQAATIDPSLRSRVIALANAALDEAEYLMEHGDPRMKAMLIRNFMSVFSRNLRAEKETSEEFDELKKSFEQLRRDMFGRVPGVIEGESSEDIEEAVVVDGPSSG